MTKRFYPFKDERKNMNHLERLGLLDILKRLAEGIVAVVGPHCEVVVHDFSSRGYAFIAKPAINV
jgi:predicted transcriptional regulator YheO